MQQQFTVVRGEVVHPKGEAAHHAWSSGLCDCTGDWCSCLSVWCCSSVTTAQLFTRFFGTKLAGIPPALLCVGVCIFLVVSSISSSTGTISESQIVSYPAESAHPADSAYSYAGDGADELPQYPYQHDAPLQSHGRLLSELAAENPVISLIGVLGSLFTCLTICQVRMAIRKRDGILESNCQGCEDLCCAGFCNPCTQCLIFRHEGLVGGKYSLCSPIGTPLQV